MKDPDKLPKQHPFTVPDEYFDKLPGRIQSRVAGDRRVSEPAFGRVIRLALAGVLLGAVAFVWVWRSNTLNSMDTAEDMLASLTTADLVAYLEYGDITTDELLDEVSFSAEDANQIEDAVFADHLNDEDLSEWVNEIN